MAWRLKLKVNKWKVSSHTEFPFTGQVVLVGNLTCNVINITQNIHACICWSVQNAMLVHIVHELIDALNSSLLLWDCP